MRKPFQPYHRATADNMDDFLTSQELMDMQIHRELCFMRTIHLGSWKRDRYKSDAYQWIQESDNRKMMIGFRREVIKCFNKEVVIVKDIEISFEEHLLMTRRLNNFLNIQALNFFISVGE